MKKEKPSRRSASTPSKADAIAPATSTAMPTPNTAAAPLRGRRKRFSSRRSPAMVSTRKALQSGTAEAIGLPANSARFAFR